jgi:hypothetical protein
MLLITTVAKSEHVDINDYTKLCMCVCVCVCVCIYIYIYIYIHTHVYIWGLGWRSG